MSDPQEAPGRATDAAVAATGREGAAVGEHRPQRDEVEDVVEGPVPGPVLGPEVEDHVGAEGPHRVELGGGVDGRHVRPGRPEQLQGEGARSPRRHR